ncbi:Heat shock protein HSP20 (modular protein) [Rhodospirillaceae bacterium LM-1]|nr:Heat shock protein HSP20 (modular protein) [Rhodospirillaceae bacterium LM-1]
MSTKTLEKTGKAPVGKAGAAKAPVSFEYPSGWLFEGLADFDRMFDSFMGGLPMLRDMERSLAALPKMDVAKTETGFEVTMDLPGMDEADVKLTLKDGLLTIEGEKKSEAQEKGKDKEYHRVERHHETVMRSLRLPETVDADKITARMEKGVMTVSLPKLPAAAREPRKIEVKGK